MGRKRWKNRKHVLFYSACFLITMSMAGGCVIPAEKFGLSKRKIIQAPPPEVVDPVKDASGLVSKKKYDDAVKAYSNISKNYPRVSPGDRALFEMGVLYTYPDYSKKSYYKALSCFRQLLKEFPKSPLREEASAWTEALNRLILSEKKIEELEGEIDAYQEKIDSYQEQINALKEIDIRIEEKKRKGLPEE